MQRSKESKAMSELLKHLLKSVPRESIPWQQGWMSGAKCQYAEISFTNLAHSNILDRLLKKDGINQIYTVNFKLDINGILDVKKEGR